MTPLVALLTLAARAAAAPSPDAAASIEHVPLPVAADALSVRVDALGRVVALAGSPADLAAVARAVRRAPRAVCAGLVEAPGELRLICRSNRLVARLVPRERGALLDVRETRGLPWGGDTGAPLVPLDPTEVGLGGACPGSTPEGRAECCLAAGDLAGARAALDGAESAAAALRLGDLAFAEGDTHAAASHWARARGLPWERLAALRLCELDPSCMTGPRAASLYDAAGLPPSAARDLLARRARALAFADRPLDGARLLLESETGRSACAAAAPLCRRVALAAIRAAEPDGTEALALWLATPDRDRGLYELEVATADGAERAGAPLFAAAVLAGAVSLAPPAALGEHLLRTTELYLAGGDRVRAGVVYEFARARAGKRGLQGARWAAVARGAGVKDGKGRAAAIASSTSTSNPNANPNPNPNATSGVPNPAGSSHPRERATRQGEPGESSNANEDPDLLAAARVAARAHALTGAAP